VREAQTILILCDDYFLTDSLQLGFKRGVGCADAIFTLKSVISNFTGGGSSICVASLDISKAFDKVIHNKLYNSLLAAGVPFIVVKVLCC
jgi:Reverse transcriptase (RNA-dependent DNA polymerase)